MFRTNLGQRILRNHDVIIGFKTQRSAVRMAALHYKFPGLRWKKKLAFLLHHGDSLATSARLQIASDYAIQKDAARERLQRAGNNLQESGFPAGVWAENGYNLARFGLKAGSFQCENRRLLRIWRISITDLFDAQPWLVCRATGVSAACGIAHGTACGIRACRRGHANLRRNK